MDKSDIENMVTGVVSGVIGVDASKIKPTDLLRDHYADSLDMVEITLHTEEMFHVEIPDADAEHFHTVHDIARYVETHAPADQFEKPRVDRQIRAGDVPRRARMDQWCEAELKIQEAVDSVEAMGADVKLTKAVILLGQARESVADYLDGTEQPWVNQVEAVLGQAREVKDHYVKAGAMGLMMHKLDEMIGTLESLASQEWERLGRPVPARK